MWSLRSQLVFESAYSYRKMTRVYNLAFWYSSYNQSKQLRCSGRIKGEKDLYRWGNRDVSRSYMNRWFSHGNDRNGEIRTENVCIEKAEKSEETEQVTLWYRLMISPESHSCQNRCLREKQQEQQQQGARTSSVDHSAARVLLQFFPRRSFSSFFLYRVSKTERERRKRTRIDTFGAPLRQRTIVSAGGNNSAI